MKREVSRKRLQFFGGSRARVLAVLALAPAVLKGVANELFVSEYVEGSGHNKALEIFNGTGGAIDLSRYSLRIVRNGEGPFGGSFALSGLLAEGATLVVVGSRADDELKALGEVERGGAPMDFNGDDVLGLFREGALIDVVGELGGVAWGVDMTLRRHPSVVGPASVFERGEWQEWPSDTFDDLGRHTMDEDDVAVSEPSNHVTGFSAHAGPPGAISLGWTDATGTVLPQGYVLQGWRETAPALPVDGERLVEDTDFSDGTGTLFPGYGEEAVTVRGLAPATTWHFRLVPHASGDAGVDYKTDGNVPSAVATTGLPTLSLRLEPTTVDESGDLNRSMATVTLSSAPSAYPLILSIHSSDTSEATAPATVSFDDAESGLSQSFFVMAVEDGLRDGEQSVTLSVMADGFAAATAVLEVRDVDVPVSHPDALLFSEYVEGSAFNKAFELYNASDRAVALADYAVRLFRDRSEVAESSIELGGIAASLAPGDTLVIRHSQFTAYAGESTIWGSATFNGDDTLALFHRGVLVDLIGEIGPSELDLSEVTLRRRREVLAPSATFSLREWAEYPQNTFDDLGAHTLGLGEPSPEPSLHPSALRAAMDTDGTITLRWTDSSGETLPRAYLLQGWTGVPPSLPSDGMPPVIDEDLSDGRGVFEVGYGVESTKIELPVGPATTWQFRLVPFSNLSVQTDYKTEGSPATASVRSIPVLFAESFGDFGVWTVVTLGGQSEWELVNGVAQASAFGSSGPADDWLIAGPLDLSSEGHPVLSFWTAREFNDEGLDPGSGLSVLLSSDYVGTGTPAAVNAATWKALEPTLPVDESPALVSAGEVSLGGLPGPVYLAFRYRSSGTEGGSVERWKVDDVRIVELAEGARTLSLSVDPATLDESPGDRAAGIGTVTLSAPPLRYPFIVVLESLDPGELSVPAELVFTAETDGLSHSFSFVGVPDGVFDRDEVVTIRADGGDYGVAEAEVTVRNTDAPPALHAVVEPASIFEDAGAAAARLIITLPSDPLGGYPVELSLISSAPDRATVPAVLTVTAADERTVEVPVTAVWNGVADGDQVFELRVEADVYTAASAHLEVVDVDQSAGLGTMALLLAPRVIAENEVTTATVVLSRAPETALTITIANGDVSAASMPATVTVPAGATSASFVIEGVPDGRVDGETSFEIVLTAEGWALERQTLTMRDIDAAPTLSLEAVPTALDEGQSGQLQVVLAGTRAGEVEVSLLASDTSEVSVSPTVIIPEGQSVATVSWSALRDEAVDGDANVTVSASAPGYALTSTTLTVRDLDVDRTATLTLRETSIDEGSFVIADLRLSVPVVAETVVPLPVTLDLRLPPSVRLAPGSDAASFTFEVLDRDGWEKDETVALRVHVPGYAPAEAVLQIRNRDPRGHLLAPVEGTRVARGETIALEAFVEDPYGTLEEVAFLVGGEAIVAAPTGTSGLHRTILSVGETLGPLEVYLAIDDPSAGAETTLLGPATISVVFDPVRFAPDFVEQTFRDFTGAPPTPSEAASFLAAMEAGRSRAEVVAEILARPEVQPALKATKTMLLVYDRFPTADELFRESLWTGATAIDGEIEEEVQVPPMAVVTAAASRVFLDPLGHFPGGVRGVAHVLLHRRSEAVSRFGGELASLGTGPFFKPLWRSRHGVDPTPQQVVQAHTRLQVFRNEASREAPQMEPMEFARARFIEALVNEERVDGATDIIYQPPNRRLAEEARAGLLRAALWQEVGFSREAIGGIDGDLLKRIEAMLDHPRYWHRENVGSVWLGASVVGAAPGWYESAWFGLFHYTLQTWPWVYHDEHGWIVAAHNDVEHEGVWFYDRDLGWGWTSDEGYPWVYFHREEGWLYFLEVSGNGRLFYDAAAQAYRWVARRED